MIKFIKKPDVFKSTTVKVIDLLESQKLKVCGSYNVLEKTNEDDLICLNPSNQKCFNSGWFSYQDFKDWTEGIGKIVKGATDEEKQKFWKIAVFEATYDYGWAIGYYMKFFDLIDENYRPKYRNEQNNPKPLKITKTNHKDIIAKVFGHICGYYSDLKVEYDSNSNRDIKNELVGAKQSLYLLGVGYYGACNTPCEAENLNWIADIVTYKAVYLYMLKNNIDIPDYEFMYKTK